MALGDSFHDGGGPAAWQAAIAMTSRSAATRARLDLDRRQPRPRSGAGDRRHLCAERSRSAPLVFRHEPTGAAGEIAGHLHPSARIAWRGHAVVRRCFAADGERVVMPAFGAYTGGLSILDRAFAQGVRLRVLSPRTCSASRRLYAFPAAHCAG